MNESLLRKQRKSPSKIASRSELSQHLLFTLKKSVSIVSFVIICILYCFKFSKFHLLLVVEGPFTSFYEMMPVADHFVGYILTPKRFHLTVSCGVDDNELPRGIMRVYKLSCGWDHYWSKKRRKRVQEYKCRRGAVPQYIFSIIIASAASNVCFSGIKTAGDCNNVIYYPSCQIKLEQ